jgi:hypothetical protein
VFYRWAEPKSSVVLIDGMVLVVFISGVDNRSRLRDPGGWISGLRDPGGWISGLRDPGTAQRWKAKIVVIVEVGHCCC